MFGATLTASSVEEKLFQPRVLLMPGYDFSN